MFVRVDPATPPLMRRYRRNRAALIEVAASAVAALPEQIPDSVTLLASPSEPQTVINVLRDGQPFYPADARASGNAQVGAYLQNNQAFIPGYSDYRPEDEIPYPFVRSLDDRMGKQFMQAPVPYGVPARYAAMLTVFGIGLGWHLPTLLAEQDVLHLILYEADAKLFQASLFSIDWEAVARRFRGTGRSLTIIIEPDPALGAAAIFAALQASAPALLVGSRYFRLYQSPEMDQAAGLIANHLPLLGYGWGHFKDECRQVVQTRQNLEKSYPWIRRRGAPLEEAHAVIVGAGPSLDKTMPLLRQIRERVVVFSAGTAIRPLVLAGIVPDFHVEVETAPSTADVLATLADQGIFDRVALLVANGMAPAALSLFSDTRVFGRDSSVSTDLLARDLDAVPGCYPVVGNAATGLAYALGFRRVTLLGVDFGYVDPDRHHATGTIYIDEKTGKALENLSHVGITGAPVVHFRDIRKRLVSTGGGELLAEASFHMSHASMETFLRRFPDLALIQCGDGARLAGATNWTPAQFDPEVYSGQRSTVLEPLARRFEERPVSAEEYAKRMERLADAADAICRRLRRLFSDPAPTPIDYARRISEGHQLILRSGEETPGLVGLVFGLFASYCKATVERSFMATDPQEQTRFLVTAQKVLVEMLESLPSATVGLRTETLGRNASSD